ncbi:MAG: apolipoprotein N-acyltransferase [Halofilum sp. (in: g-proteobacteria)]
MSTLFLNNRTSRLSLALANLRWGDGAALIAGAALVLAFAPFGWWPLAVLAPACLFWLWRDCGRGRAAWRGWLFGLGYWGAGVHWIYFSLHHFGAAVAPLAALLTALFAMGLALTLALLGFLVASGDPRKRSPAWFLLTLPGAWLLLEWFRSWFMTGFPWLLIGTSQLDAPLAPYAPVIGVYGVGLVLALTAGVIAGLPRLAMGARVVALVAVAVLWAGAPLVGERDWTQAAGEPFEAAVVQGNFSQSSKFESLDEALARYSGLTRQLAGDVQLVLWPETAVPTFYREVAPRLSDFAEEMAGQGTQVVTGVFTHGGERTYYNAVRALGGEQPNEYRKQRLVPFGEYLPLRSLLAPFERFIQVPMSDIAAGSADQAPLRVGDYRVGASVCYEAAYPGVIRDAVPEADVLANVSNDAWFGDSTAPPQHLEIARMRALETGRPMLRATNTGISAIIGHRGDLIARGPQFEAAVVRGDVTPREGLTPYARWGDLPIIGLAALLALSSAGLARLGGGQKDLFR